MDHAAMSESEYNTKVEMRNDEKHTGCNLTEVGSVKPSTLPETAISEARQDPATAVKGPRLLVIMIGFLLASSLMALDQTIISTALPSIASDFNAISQLSWIASGYFLAQAGLMLLYGRILAIVRGKHVLLVAIAIFMAGSLICALANTIQLLIFGRVVAGAGGGGIYVSVLAILAQIVPLEKRPIYLGSFGAVFAVSSIIGPLLGGVFSEHLTWRWCFWINLPLGGLALVVVAILLPAGYNPAEDANVAPSPWWARWIALDWLGSAFSIAVTVTFLLPMQWGGNQKAWDDPAVIALLCVAAVLTGMFIVWEAHQGENALLPMKLLTHRTQIGACLVSMLLFVCFVIGTYFLPFFYQVKGSSATQSGINILPYMLSGVISAAVAGAAANMTHHYWSFIAFPPAILASVGAGLLFTVKSSTSTAKLIGYQILFGTGVGAAMQNTIMSVQAEFASHPDLVSQATSVCTFSQTIGLSIGIAIGGAVLDNEFMRLMAQIAPDVTSDVVQAVKQNVEVIATLPPLQRTEVIDVYTTSVSRVFLVCVPCAILASLSAGLIKSHKLVQVPV